MKIAHINENNKLLGWYDKEIHTSIPTPNISVSDTVWQNAINNGHNKVNQDGYTEMFDFRTQEEIEERTIEYKIQEAKTYLSSTDWYVTRKAETGVEIPEDVTTKRTKAREFLSDNNK